MVPPAPQPDADEHDLAVRLAEAEAFMLEPLRQGTLPTLGPGAEVAARLGTPVPDLSYPTVTVVGSKGKGTAAIACSAALASAGLCVGTVTSPSLISARERIRVDGRPVDAHTYLNVVDEIRHVYDEVAAEHPDWVLPRLGGLSLLGSLRVFADARVDAAVFEGSMGGRSDLTHIVGSEVVVITEVFAEHLGALGNTLAEIATEKVGAVTDRTRVLVTVEQSTVVWDSWAETGLLDGLEVVVVGRGSFGHHTQPLIDRNLELGRVAAQVWRNLFDPTPGEVSLPAGLRLPGRCQPLPGGVMVDCAISGPGAAAALTAYRTVYGHAPRHVYVMLPATKDDTGVLAVLDDAGVDVTAVEVAGVVPRLRPDPLLWGNVAAFDDLDLAGQSEFLAFGTVAFAAAVLRVRGVDVETLW